MAVNSTNIATVAFVVKNPFVLSFSMKAKTQIAFP